MYSCTPISYPKNFLIFQESAHGSIQLHNYILSIDAYNTIICITSRGYYTVPIVCGEYIYI